ncbi:MAG: SRPBCC domain-containing protein [Anaerolineales bacterium]|nr:SRPBCC domain-containing protein [Xanthobacteraceae bacterium]MCW5886505.1 SRPBCC domain-containing protein [Anaerolineales bacterium]
MRASSDCKRLTKHENTGLGWVIAASRSVCDTPLERLYPNCKEHVWAAWSIREKKAAWLGSKDLEMDFFPGGIERSGFRNSMGEHTSEGRYFEIKEGERIVLGPVDKVDSQISGSMIQDCLLGGGFGSRRPDRYGMADHRGAVAHRAWKKITSRAR